PPAPEEGGYVVAHRASREAARSRSLHRLAHRRARAGGAHVVPARSLSRPVRSPDRHDFTTAWLPVESLPCLSLANALPARSRTCVSSTIPWGERRPVPSSRGHLVEIART